MGPKQIIPPTVAGAHGHSPTILWARVGPLKYRLNNRWADYSMECLNPRLEVRVTIDRKLGKAEEEP
jgi:hypothetical protein